MAETNRTLMQKADLQLAQLTPGGTLPVEVAKEFMILAIREPVMLKEALLVDMVSPQYRIPKLRFGGRVLRRGRELTGLTFAARATPDITSVTLTSQLYKAEVTIDDEALEDNIEQGRFKETVLGALSKAVGRDLEFSAVNSATTSADDMLSMQDGWIQLNNTNIVLGGVAQLDTPLLRDLTIGMPVEFSTDPALKYYTNRFARLRYLDALRFNTQSGVAAGNVQRSALGDAALSGNPNDNAHYQGATITYVPEFPSNLGAGTNETVVMYANPKNFVMGVHRAIRVEMARDVRAGGTVFVASMRVAYNVVEPLAAVKLTGVLGQ